MSTVALRASLVRGLTLARDQASVLAFFTAALFLSALLLFSVQPIFAKMVLPKLGGSPAVWAVSMVFFQAVLLAGYGYAHALNRHVAPRQAPLVHLFLMAAAALALPFGLPAFGAEPPAGDAYFWLIGVLAVGVGLPFFAVSANAPLLQSWFARSGHPQAADPYFLYGASNFGSLIALLAYPFAIEPVIGLTRQASIWTAGFLTLGMMIAFCGLLVMPARGAASAVANAADDSDHRAVSWADRAGWVWLAAIPSGLLVSFTSYVTTDIASAPFLWVIPLALFLATFIMVFRDQPMLPHGLMVRMQPILVALTVLGLSSSTRVSWVLAVTAGLAAFFVSTLVCHKELYDKRPASRHLTAFYMWMSLGGVVGGVFAALIAPQVFNAIYEFPLLLLAGLASRAGLAKAWNDEGERAISVRVLAIAVLAVLAIAHAIAHGLIGPSFAAKMSQVVAAACALYVLLVIDKPLRQVSIACAMAASLMILPSNMNFGFAERSFFGVHRVGMSPDGTMRMLYHGTTVHGAMRVKEDDGTPVSLPRPVTYYHAGAPMPRGAELARLSTGKTDGGLVVGIIGVGTGTMACYSRGNEDWRFYEIDPVVVKIASDPKQFRFFDHCRPKAHFVMGDARLTLGKDAAGSFDYLLIDAFSSDSIPVHLLTREALALYLSRLTPNGVLALHVSNRHMDLADVAANLVRSVPGIHGVVVHDKPSKFSLNAAASSVVLVARSPEALAPALAWQGATAVTGGVTGKPWTDDYSNVIGAILRNYGY